MVRQPCEYTKNPWSAHFKRVNVMGCELYLDKVFFLLSLKTLQGYYKNVTLNRPLKLSVPQFPHYKLG